MPLQVDLTDLNELAGPARALLDHMLEDRVVARLWGRDHTLWRPDPDEILNRLGWLDSAATMPASLPEIAAVTEAVRQAGLSQALLLGMGGSSLAPEVFRKVFGVGDGFLDLTVLDSTHPTAVLAAAESLDPRQTLYIPATKSGGTVETLSFLKFFYRRAVERLGDAAGSHFAAITDPGSGLADLAGELDFRHIFLNDPDIGGRYSALSMFGLVPASLVGVDVDRLLQRARAAAAECSVESGNPASELAAVMAAGARAGRDKITLIATRSLAPFGAWVEQLIAESTGKDGSGILPVDGEAAAGPQAYGPDRIFAYLRLEGDESRDEEVASLAGAGHPVVRLDLQDVYDLGGQFLLWEIATALAGHALDIHPFDQPDVEAAKVLARSMTEAYLRDGALPESAPSLVEGDLSVYGYRHSGGPDSGETAPATLADTLRRALDLPLSATPRPYVAIHAYLAPSAVLDQALEALRLALRDHLQVAVTVGYGPRFLHSTGQLHKGDAGNGLFLQLTATPPRDADIPDRATGDASTMTFGVLVAAQAQGDGQALAEAGRRVLRLHLGSDVAGGLERIRQALAAVLA